MATVIETRECGRFWVRRGDVFRVDDLGYTSFAAKDIRHRYNPAIRTTSEIGDLSTVQVLLGEPGSGKSFELGALLQQAESVGMRHVKFLDLGRYADAATLATALRRVLRDCIDSRVATSLFLDALDECRVNIKRAETVLEEVLLETSANLLNITIACRTPAWPSSLEDVLRSHWSGKDDISVFEICPHSTEQVGERLRQEGIPESDFFAAMNQASAHGLSLHPLGLQFLMSEYKDSSTFSSSRWDLYERGCTALVKPSKRAAEDGNVPLPNPRQRLQLAGLMAVCSLLTNTTDITLDTDTQRKRLGETPIDVASLAKVPLKLHDSTWHAERLHCLEVLQSGLFVRKDDGVFSFAHRTYAEFLAAHFIASLKLRSDVEAKILTLPDDSTRLAPQLRELAAWMSHGNSKLLDFLLTIDPALILDSSISLLDEQDVSTAFDELVKLVARHKFPLYEPSLIRSYPRLAHGALQKKLLAILQDRTGPSSIRQFAANVALAVGHIRDISELVSIALDATDDYEVRQSAANAIRDSDCEELHAALLPLLCGFHAEDHDDELKGIAFHCALKLEMPLRLLVAHLTEEKRPNYAGAYASALFQLRNVPVGRLDLPSLLSWLQGQLNGPDMEYSRAETVFRLFDKAAHAVIAFDEGWRELGQAAWSAISNHRRLSLTQSTCHFDSALELASQPIHRHRLFESMLSVATGDANVIAMILGHTAGLLTNSDGQYIVQLYGGEQSESAKTVLAHILVGRRFDSDRFVLEWLLSSAGPGADNPDPLLRTAAKGLMEAIPLDSPEAHFLRECSSAIPQKNVSSPPEGTQSIDLLLTALERSERGDTWEWMNILSYLVYDDTFKGYQSPAGQVTQLALWCQLEPNVCARVGQAAVSYLRDAAPHLPDLMPNQGNAYEICGIAALVFVQETGLGREADFPAITVKWARALARYNLDNQPREAIDALLSFGLATEPQVVESHMVRICAQYLKSDLPRMPDFTEALMPAAVENSLEALLPQLPDGHGFLVLCSYLGKRGVASAAVSLSERMKGQPDLSTTFSSKALKLLATLEPRRLVDEVWPRLSISNAAVNGFAAEFQMAIGSQSVPFLQVSATVTEQLFEMLESSFPSSTDLPFGGLVAPQHHMQGFRNCCIHNLMERASVESIMALERIAYRHPELPWIKTIVHDAEQKAARDAWVPFSLDEALVTLGFLSGRVVRTPAELHAVVTEELQSIARKVSARSANPFVYFLWDESPQKPKHEPRLCDWLAGELGDRLSSRGAVVNREVQVRSHNPKGIGERTDILIEAHSAELVGSENGVMRIVVEVKGCWNDDLETSAAVQLRDNYMYGFKAQFGIYLVLWFLCERWSDDDWRKAGARRHVPNGTFAACEELIARVCSSASSNEVCVSPIVLDCTY